MLSYFGLNEGKLTHFDKYEPMYNMNKSDSYIKFQIKNSSLKRNRLKVFISDYRKGLDYRKILIDFILIFFFLIDGT